MSVVFKFVPNIRIKFNVNIHQIKEYAEGF